MKIVQLCMKIVRSNYGHIKAWWDNHPNYVPPPHTKVGGDIVFGTGPVGISVDIKLRRLCNLNTLWNIMMILGRNVDQDEMMCRIQD